MPDLLTTIREALVAEGASPALADWLAANHVPDFLKRIRRERDTNEAQRLLPMIGAVAAAERLGVCKKTIYNRARKCNSRRTVAQEPA